MRIVRDGDEGGGDGGAGVAGLGAAGSHAAGSPRTRLLVLLPAAAVPGGSSTVMGVALHSGHVGTCARSCGARCSPALVALLDSRRWNQPSTHAM